ncbi:hypothetical protein L207DRAFT_514703 [Hyaloscypha variabilis F]|uniref:RRM domain-containing protein n=1 Tax=Hyaloscypha variabilis (strain UAMH 11265 / GT02V1 / F) TaxID=1149755 RepID=A0A2J6RG13_HYAVF|nr:hypothetical protein L207DRAFT_514703 [Hyaloscypha variabilis F]
MAEGDEIASVTSESDTGFLDFQLIPRNPDGIAPDHNIESHRLLASICPLTLYRQGVMTHFHHKSSTCGMRAVCRDHLLGKCSKKQCRDAHVKFTCNDFIVKGSCDISRLHNGGEDHHKWYEHENDLDLRLYLAKSCAIHWENPTLPEDLIRLEPLAFHKDIAAQALFLDQEILPLSSKYPGVPFSSILEIEPSVVLPPGSMTVAMNRKPWTEKSDDKGQDNRRDTILVNNIPEGTTEDEIRAFFYSFGTFKYAKVLSSKVLYQESSASKVKGGGGFCTAFITFTEQDAGVEAKTRMHGYPMGSNRLVVKWPNSASRQHSGRSNEGNEPILRHYGTLHPALSGSQEEMTARAFGRHYETGHMNVPLHTQLPVNEFDEREHAIENGANIDESTFHLPSGILPEDRQDYQRNGYYDHRISDQLHHQSSLFTNLGGLPIWGADWYTPNPHYPGVQPESSTYHAALDNMHTFNSFNPQEQHYVYGRVEHLGSVDMQSSQRTLEEHDRIRVAKEDDNLALETNNRGHYHEDEDDQGAKILEDVDDEADVYRTGTQRAGLLKSLGRTRSLSI